MKLNTGYSSILMDTSKAKLNRDAIVIPPASTYRLDEHFRTWVDIRIVNVLEQESKPL